MAWFGESQGRVIVSCAPDSVEEIVRVTDELGVSLLRLGETKDSSDLVIRTGSREDRISLERLWKPWSSAISSYMD